MLEFGQMVFGPFPFLEGDAEKNRWAFVLKDEGSQVVVAYCTTNPSIEGAVSLGKCSDKVSNLVAYRWEVIQKERLHLHKGVIRPGRWSKPILDMVGLCAKAGVYKGYSTEILAETARERSLLAARIGKNR